MSAIRSTTVIFDLDGTLVDSEPNYYEASLRTLAEHGVTGFTWADHERYVGISMRETVSDWQERYGLTAPVEAIAATKNRHYLELARTGTRVYPQMRKFVELLAAEGVSMAVASGSSREVIEVILGATGLDASLRTVVSAEEVDRGKPGARRVPGGRPSAGRRPGRLCRPGGRGAGRGRRPRGRYAVRRGPLSRRPGR
jgi:beta-phosphoglucomutase-like phosphatase (HAD superfamily)